MAAADVVQSYLSSLPGGTRRLAAGEWGITVPAESAAGWPLDVGLRLADGMVRAQALAARADSAPDPRLLLWWNRQTRYVRFGCTRSGDVWVHGDLPVAGLDERALDRLLGLIVEAAVAVRR